MKWLDITRWVNVFVLVMLIAIRIWEFKKIRPDDPNSPIEKRLIFIELWIFVIYSLMRLVNLLLRFVFRRFLRWLLCVIGRNGIFCNLFQ